MGRSCEYIFGFFLVSFTHFFNIKMAENNHKINLGLNPTFGKHNKNSNQFNPLQITTTPLFLFFI